MPKHELHSYQDCPATIAWLRGDTSVRCQLISVEALLSSQEFNYYQETRGGLRHARVNDDHCKDDHTAGNVVVEGLRGYNGIKSNYEIFRPTPDSLNPWVKITKEN